MTDSVRSLGAWETYLVNALTRTERTFGNLFEGLTICKRTPRKSSGPADYGLSMTLLHDQVDQLLNRVRREVDEGLLPSCQVALGYQGEIVVEETFGDADLNTRYSFFSATKAFVAAAIWQLISEGVIDVDRTVASYLPEFATEGKDDITVEQVMLHTSGFPHAPLGPPRWNTSKERRAAFAQWRLNWEPGTRYEYHPTSAHWVLAEIMNEVTGNDYRDEVQRRVTDPLGLPRIVGIPLDDQENMAELVATGEHATPDELEAVFGMRELPGGEVNDEFLLRFNQSDQKEVGVPGGGGWGRARDLAAFYQALLHNPDELWEPSMLADATSRVRNVLPDPAGVPANRSLGLILAGDDGYANMRGLGRSVSPATFGHNGAGGQLAWVDPATGLSLGYCTNGLDRHEIRQPRRGTAISSIAGTCATVD
jgi:CubicO group peptidase (beta-lactamase class C family)